jgi:hypothetical protein
MTMARYLRGYHWDSGQLGVDIYLDQDLWHAIQDVLPLAARDRDPIDPVKLTSWQTGRVADATGLPIDPSGYDYFLEADEHWRVVAEIRDSLFAEV